MQCLSAKLKVRRAITTTARDRGCSVAMHLHIAFAIGEGCASPLSLKVSTRSVLIRYNSIQTEGLEAEDLECNSRVMI